MSIITPQEFEKLLPLACAWAAEQERTILESGAALTEPQLADARRVRVAHPERVRLLPVVRIPLPAHSALAAAARATNLISPSTHGLTLRYGIFVRADCWGQRALIVHELVHTAQYERLGDFDAFLRRYLMECITPPGYPHGALEQEAVTTASEILSDQKFPHHIAGMVAATSASAGRVKCFTYPQATHFHDNDLCSAGRPIFLRTESA
jgi:hypothetical protein